MYNVSMRRSAQVSWWLFLCVSLVLPFVHRLCPANAAEPPSPASPAEKVGTMSLRHIPGSTVKLEQLIGDYDKQKKANTLNQTFSRYRIQGADLGYPFEHEGKIIFLFGDTLGRWGGDTMASSATVDPEKGLTLDFYTDAQGRYLKVEPPGVSMKGFEVPVSGISSQGKMYVVVKTNHSPEAPTDVSIVTWFDGRQQAFKVLREISRLPHGKFIKMSLRHQPEPLVGLPPGGPHIFMWGSGVYRRSHAYLAVVPARELESGKGTRYFAGMGENGVPRWSEREEDAQPVVEHSTIGDLSVTWAPAAQLWLMTYDSRQPRGIVFRHARFPWGPWSEPQVIFDAMRDQGLGHFIHKAHSEQDDGLAGPVIGAGKTDPQAVQGGAYAPYVIERFTRLEGDHLKIYFVLSTWNPYVIVLMRSEFQVVHDR